MVNHNRTTARELHRAGISRFNLVFNLEAAEQRRIVAVALYLAGMFWHHMCDELLGLFIHIIGVDQNVANIRIEIIANGANDQAGFLVNQECAFAAFGSTINSGP